MALQITYDTTYGFRADTAYAHIILFSGSKTSIRVDIMVFISKEARDNNSSNIGFMSANLQLADGASMQEMYDALKLQEPFIGAVDV